MSQLYVDNIKGRLGGAVGAPSGIVVTGVGTFSGNASFSGNVSIGGTLTYEDVTNIDSVGVVTARSGIKVGAGQSISAVSGTIYYYGDGSNLQNAGASAAKSAAIANFLGR